MLNPNDDAELLAYFAGQALNALLSKASVAPLETRNIAELALSHALAMRQAFRVEHPKG